MAQELRILIIGEDPSFLQRWRTLLADAGFTALIHQLSEKEWRYDQINENQLDCIVIDYQNEYQLQSRLLAKLRRQVQIVPLVAVYDAAFQKLPNEPADFHMTDLFETEEVSKALANIIQLKRLKKQVQNAEKLARVKQDFLANMSHEIRTPMNAIIGFTDLLAKTQLDESQKEYLDAIKSSGENLLVIINDILDFSSIESGKLNIEKTDFRLSKVLKDVHNLFALKAKEKNIAFKIAKQEIIPDSLIGDPVRLRQVLINLIGNAVKFTPSGKIALNISYLGESMDSVALEFVVSDTGIGISKDKLYSIFESFTQEGEDTTRKFGGSGLGLAICKRLVELQGGNIHAESEKDKGARFIFSLTYIKNKTNIKSVERAEFSEELTPTKPLNVLVVDDNALNLKLAKKLLEAWGHNVMLAENGKLGIERLGKDLVDIILMDIQMPVMGGVEASRFIREQLKSDVPILAVTANAFKDEVEQYMDAGMNDYITKPFKREELFEKVSVLTSVSRGSQKAAIAEEPISEDPVIDLDNLRELANDDEDFIREILELFLTKTPENLSAFYESVEKEAWKEVQKMAHKLRSSTSAVGLTKAESLLEEIEIAAQQRDENFPHIPQMSKRVVRLCEKAFDEIKQEIAKGVE